MQTLAPPLFCPLTNPQPYQREQDDRRPLRASMVRSECVLAMQSVNAKRVAVRSNWLGSFGFCAHVCDLNHRWYRDTESWACDIY
jgi:hypothetical protein